VPQLPWSQIEALLAHDPGRRGVAALLTSATHDASSLEAAAKNLAESACSVAIVTGFVIAGANPPAAETDGPPGALYLAKVLVALGFDVTLISDEYGVPLLKAGCDRCGLSGDGVYCFPFEPGGPDAYARRFNGPGFNPLTDRWVDQFLTTGAGRSLSHLIAIERVGPSHTPETVSAQRRSTAAPLTEFEQDVPREARDVCHNMRGVPVNALTAKTHRLFEEIARRRLPITTIGIGDGGNEIGMGNLPWEVLKRAITTGPGGRIACRIPTDHLLLAGVSNWGAYALATLTACHSDRRDVLASLSVDAERQLIERLVSEAGAVDGVTRQRQATVDGLALDNYLAVLREIRRLCGVAG
jgi:hypothetical protein